MQALEDQATRTDRTLNLVAQAVASVASAVSQLPSQLANAAIHPQEPTPGTLPAGVKRRQLPHPTIRQHCACGCELFAEVDDICSKCQSQVAERCRPGGMCPLCQYGEARDDGSIALPTLEAADLKKRANRQLNIASGLDQSLQLAALHVRPDWRDAMLFVDSRVLEAYLVGPNRPAPPGRSCLRGALAPAPGNLHGLHAACSWPAPSEGVSNLPTSGPPRVRWNYGFVRDWNMALPHLYYPDTCQPNRMLHVPPSYATGMCGPSPHPAPSRRAKQMGACTPSAAKP